MSNDHDDLEPLPTDLPAVAAVAAWGAAQRMPTAVSEAIFAEIIASPAPELTQTRRGSARRERDLRPAAEGLWWRNHASALAATMVSSNRWSPAA